MMVALAATVLLGVSFRFAGSALVWYDEVAAVQLAWITYYGSAYASHGGFLYYEVLELLQEVSKRHYVIGIDLVEVAPDYDASGSTQILAAQILMNFLGFIFHHR